MIRMIIIALGLLVILTGLSPAQTVTVPDFPLGIGSNVSGGFLKPYDAKLQMIVDTLTKYPRAIGIVSGGADGEQFRKQNDAKNPALALGRAHLLRNYIIETFRVNPNRLFIQSNDVKLIGSEHRYAAIRIQRATTDLDLETRIDALEKREPIERHFTQVKEITSVPAEESLGLVFGLGLTSSPFGGIPVVSTGFAWKKTIYVEGIVGHTFWNSSFRHKGVDLDTKRRLVGGQIVYYPYDDKPIGIVAGWMRIEEISQDFYEYVQLSDGPTLGLKASLFDVVTVSGLYNPSKTREAGSDLSKSKNGQFLFSIGASFEFGGEK